MSAPDGSSAATEPNSTTTSSRSLMRRLPPLEELSPITQDTVLSIGEMMKEGYKPTEIAASLRLPLDFVSQRLEQLRREIEEYEAGPLALSEQEKETLRLSIEEVGIHTPIILGDHSLIDGFERYNIAKDLGLTGVKVSYISGLTEQQEYDLRITLNVARRQMNRDQKTRLVEHELDRDWSRSDRLIGTLCAVDHKTVGSIR